ncbi:MAG: acyl-CoA thioesterase [Hyphomicrobiaceae bacterium]|nr:acyl-CoA thioesterase [Hyphomicrobiaceae bacterium]
MTLLPFRHYVRVRYQECDTQLVVFNARYGDYIDLGITQFLMAAMPGRDLYDGTFEIQLKKQVIEWFAPARFNDVIEIRVWVSRFGRTSFDVRFELRIAGKEDVIVNADTVYVHVRGEKGVWKSSPVPEEARALLEAGARGKIVDHAGWLPVRPSSS